MALEHLQISLIPANAVRDMFKDADTGEADARFVMRPSQCSLAIWGTGKFEWSLFSQDRTIVQRSTGDTSAPAAGNFPKLNERAFTFPAAALDKLRLTVRETGGVATTNIMAVIDITPMM
jgi:hypothetical protein